MNNIDFLLFIEGNSAFCDNMDGLSGHYAIGEIS